MMDRSDVTLYSGGLKGAEAEFGSNADRWGLQEVNFTFTGHEMERDKNARFLSEEELSKGDVSMEIVIHRMGRTYSSVDAIRRVMQSIFHMVNSGYQVFAIGWIKENGTVKGGTGWGVELAKFFNRPLSVFDQDRNGWFSWDGREWVADEPVIAHKTFAGTGTRNITEAGRAAIRSLFERSFGTAPAAK